MPDTPTSIELAGALTVAWLGNSHTHPKPDEVPAFLIAMHDAVAALDRRDDGGKEEPAAEYLPAVSVRKSLADPNFIISMIDGRPYRSLARHLSSRGISQDEYRQRYGLKADYPLVAPAYSAARSDAAKARGFGRKPGEKAPRKASTNEVTPKGRKSVAEAKKAAQAHLGLKDA